MYKHMQMQNYRILVIINSEGKYNHTQEEYFTSKLNTQFKSVHM
jgi:hypothetical protein